MYTLYYSPGACSLATHTILNLIGQQPRLVYTGSAENFEQINPSKMVPVLQDGDQYLTEGAAIILHLLDNHENDLLPASGAERQAAIQNMMMANASMHPAYGRLFFSNANLPDGEVKAAFFDAAAEAISAIWKIVEDKFEDGPYLGGAKVSPADILLAVYSRWGEFFPVEISIGPKAQRMIDLVTRSDAFQLALQRQTEDHKTHAA